MSAYRLAPGARVVFRGDSKVDLYPPLQGFPQRSILAPSWSLRLFDALEKPAQEGDLVRNLTGLATPDAVRALLAEIVRFGIARIEHPLPGVPSAPDDDAGFVVFALGDRRYGRLAYNATMSIKACYPTGKVAVCHEGDALAGLSANRRSVFDTLVECPKDVARPGGLFSPPWAKLHTDLLTPFRHTVVVDADTVVFPGAALGAELLRYRHHDFAPTCSFTHLPDRIVPGDRIILWADVAECVRRFGLARPIRQTHLFYYALSRTDATSELFRTARNVYQGLTVRPLPSMRTWYAGRVSAELAMSIATSQCDFTLYSESHVPVMNNAMAFVEGLQERYLGFTFCGVPPDAAWQARYDGVVRAVTPRGVTPYLWKRIVTGAGE